VPAGWVGIDGGSGVDFGSDAWRSPDDVLGVTAGKGFVEVAVYVHEFGV